MYTSMSAAKPCSRGISSPIKTLTNNFSRRVLICHATPAENQSTAPTETTAKPTEVSSTAGSTPVQPDAVVTNLDLDKEVTKFARNAAQTFAPRASGAVKNPAYRGSWLYTVFDVQAWVCLVIGGLLSFNVLFPSDEPDVWRLMGMWSIWMFTIPSLRARECTQAEKDALNYLFLLIPLINVALPFAIKSFPVIYTADVLALVAMFTYKGAWPWQQEEA